MATRIVTELHDDIDGSNATHTVRFALDGVEYEIDLSNRNANRLRNSFEEFVRHARKVGEGRGRKAAISARADKSQIGPMREWLREHGYEVSNRGRIPACCKGLSRPVIDHVPPEIGAHQHRWLRQGGAVDQQEFINFVRRRG